MKRTRKLLAIAASAALSFAHPVFADWAPDGTLKLLVAFGAGGSTDTVARVVGQAIETQTGWNVIVENKPGGGGVAMFSGIARMKPDGNVIGVGVNIPIWMNLHQRGDKLGFDLDSFDYLATISRPEMAMIARADAPYDTLDEFIAWSKENGPVAVSFDAGPLRLLMRSATKTTGVKFNMVSAESGAEQIKLILGGQVAAGFGSGGHLAMLEAGEIKLLASVSDRGLSYAPEVKSFAASGITAYPDAYYYIATAAGTPEDTKTALAEAIDAALSDPSVQEAVYNALKSGTENLGPAGTEKMLDDGFVDFQALFAE
ncbi:MAG: tripartite tricarboxylate transporter substrate binding protein [Pseudomonadota bacterium]